MLPRIVITRLLDRPGRRWLLGGLRTLRARAHGSAIRVGWQDGAWWQRHHEGTIPLGSGNPARWHQETLDFFCWRYTPGPGDLVVDLGAGIGTEILTWSSLVGPTGLVIAYEAHPATFDRLERLVATNGLTNAVVLRREAIADRTGTVWISDGTDSLENTIIDAADAWESQSVTLDDAYRQLPRDRIDFMKVNIEGAERFLISHGANALANTRHIAVSCHDFVADRDGTESMRTRAVVEQGLRDLGFDVRSRADDRRPWIPDYLYGTNTAFA